MRWVAAITACLLLGILGAGFGVAAPPAAVSIDAEVEATLDHLTAADLDR